MMTGTDLAAQAGLSYRQVCYWTTKGVFATADGRPHPGSGAPRNFPEEEARVGRALRDLRDLGAGVTVLAEAAAQLRTLPDEEWHGIVCVDTVGMLHRGACRGWAVDLDRAR